MSTHRITFGDTAQVDYIANLTELIGNGHRVDIDGRTVTLTADALDVLAEFDEEWDGHYDGTHVWIGGTEYLVEGSP